ncbi:efflux RND transporter periplasmic adaptor subunit [Psychroserpens sp. XS_ASV72]|uniref:efflux RND transporter periplasmic adaptor subunit n=1 Tax=Psychroserpens sp. XS_ASV72 TaxID=3241293 RepID=UPI00351862B8
MIRYKYTIYTILFATILIGCGNTKKETDNNSNTEIDNRIVISKAQFEASKMQFGSTEEKAFPISISVNGMIDVPPENRAIINSTMGGFIKTTHLLEGDQVKKGQALVTLENPEFVTLQQDYMEVKGQISYLKAEFDRQKTMMDENITSEKNYLRAESSYKSAMAKYSGLRKQLLLLNISPGRVENGSITSVITLYSPIEGSVSKVNVSKGSYVSPAVTIIEIVDNSHIHLELSVFEKDILQIKKGQNIRFKIPEASDETYDAEVYLVGTVIQDNRTIKVHGHPKDDSRHFLTGMFVNADIIINNKNAVVLPETAVVEVDNENYILTLDEEDENQYYFNQQKVDVGTTVDGLTELKNSSNIKNADKILSKGAFSLIGI